MRVALWRCCIVLFLSTAAVWGAVSRRSDPEQRQREGYLLFMRCEFKKAAQAFQEGVLESPDSAALHYWLGKSYARLVELSTFSAARNARKARGSLEQAVRLDPCNEDYLRELFDLYVDFPEFFDRGLDRAEDLIGSAGSEGSREEMSMRLLMARHNHRGLEGPLRSVTLWTVSGLGYLAPLP